MCLSLRIFLILFFTSVYSILTNTDIKMPSGGLMQLVSYGSENLYLTGNPQITFFKTAYQRHTNFAYEWIPQFFEPTLSFDTTSDVCMTVPIKRNGDLVRDIALVIDIPNIYSSDQENFKWVKNLGHVFIHTAEFIIGGQSINKLYGQWMNIWYELTTIGSRRPAFNELTGNVIEVYNPAYYYGQIGDTATPTIQKRRLRIPLPFWFTQSPGLAFPLIAIQYVESSINFNFRCMNDLFTIGIPSVSPAELFENPVISPNSNHVTLKKYLKDLGYNPNNIFWKFVSGLLNPGIWNQNVYLDIKYVYLDITERRIFAAAVSEYLITQVERLDFRGLQGNETVDLTFYHPVKEMIWVYQRDDVKSRNQWCNFTSMLSEDDYPKFLEIMNFRKNAINSGLTLNSLNDTYLPSGLNIMQFLDAINYTDSNRLSLTNIDAFDQYLNIMYFAKFIFNTHDRQSAKEHLYYQAQEPYNSHTTTPLFNRQIYMMSFAELPESIQPSGSANFSMFSESQFQMTLKERIPQISNSIDVELFNLFFYVRNLNVLRIMSGIGGLVFSS